MIASSLVKIYRTAYLIEQHGIKIRLSVEAQEVYQDSFENEQAELDEIARSDREFAGVLMGYQGRLDMMKFKVAMVFLVVDTAGRNTDVIGLHELLITGEMMRRAVALIGYFWKTVENLLMHQFKFTPHEQKMKRVVDILKQQGGAMIRRKLLQRTGWKSKEFDEVITTGTESGVLVLLEEKQGSGQVSKMVKLP